MSRPNENEHDIFKKKQRQITYDVIIDNAFFDMEQKCEYWKTFTTTGKIKCDNAKRYFHEIAMTIITKGHE